MAPSLQGRYEHSIQKGEAIRPQVEVIEGERVYVPCGGGCGRPVAPGQKCPECARAAVDAWLAERRVLAHGAVPRRAGNGRR